MSFNWFMLNKMNPEIDKSYKGTKADSYSTYEKFIKNKLGIIILQDYKQIKPNTKSLRNMKINPIIAQEFADYSLRTHQLFKQKRVINRSECSKKQNQKEVYSINSRFELINSLEDLEVLNKMIELYFQMLALSLSEKDYLNITKMLTQKDRDEINAIRNASK